MAVWVDPLRDWGWAHGPSCHLFANTLAEMHAFATQLGMRRAWFQNGRLPHYDLTAMRRVEALRLGAIELDSHAAVRRARGVVGDEHADRRALSLKPGSA